VVIKIGARADDPVDEPRLDKWNQARHAQARRREGPAERKANGCFLFKHSSREKPASLAQPPGVVRKKSSIHELAGIYFPAYRSWIDPLLANALEEMLPIRFLRIARMHGWLFYDPKCHTACSSRAA